MPECVLMRYATPDFPTVGRNFTIAKVIGILIVAAGHYFEDSLLWIPATIALFVFGFSSGYFTSLRYRSQTDQAGFWNAKITRLLPAVVVIDVFLLALFLLEGRPGIWTWQSLVSAAGLSGWLNWTGAHNPGPFGAGLWFFTLLLMFYIVYPLLRRLTQTPRSALATSLTTLIPVSVLHHTIDVGHMLWLTAGAFVLGSAAGGNRLPLAPRAYPFIFIGSLVLLAFLNAVLGLKTLNYPLLLGLCIAAVGWLLSAPLPNLGLDRLMRLDACILEIYFIHTYLFVRPADLPAAVGWMISTVLVIVVALLLVSVRRRLFERAHKPVTA
jgi:hypothetical protein